MKRSDSKGLPRGTDSSTAKTVTILIGFTQRMEHSRWITFASDSRLSGLTGHGSIHDDAVKVSPVQFANGVAVFAKAGIWAPAERFEEKFLIRAATTTISTQQCVLKCAEDTLRELRREIAQGYPVGYIIDDALRDLEFSCLIGYFFKGEPYIYSLNSTQTVVSLCRNKFKALGHAESLADFLLTSGLFDERNIERCHELAIATIELCKLHDNSCGGRVQVVTICDSDTNISQSIRVKSMQHDEFDPRLLLDPQTQRTFWLNKISGI